MPTVFKVPILYKETIEPRTIRLKVGGDRSTPLTLKDYTPVWLAWATLDPYTGESYPTQGNWTLNFSPYIFHQDFTFSTTDTYRLRELISGYSFECYESITIDVATDFTVNITNATIPPAIPQASTIHVLSAIVDIDSWNGSTYTNVIDLHDLTYSIDIGGNTQSYSTTVSVPAGRWQMAGNISITLAPYATVTWDANVSFTLSPDKAYPIIERAWITSDPDQAVVGVMSIPRARGVPIAATTYTGYTAPEYIEYADYWIVTNTATAVYLSHLPSHGTLTAEPNDWRSPLLTHDFSYAPSGNSCYDTDLEDPEINYYDDKQYQCELAQVIDGSDFQTEVRTTDIQAVVQGALFTASGSCTIGTPTNYQVDVFGLGLPGSSDPLKPSLILMLAPLAFSDEPPETTYSCNCPDYTRQHGVQSRSPYPSEAALRDWTGTEAGSPGDCKHIIAVRLYRGEQVSVPVDLPLEFMTDDEIKELEDLKTEDPGWNPFRH